MADKIENQEIEIGKWGKEQIEKSEYIPFKSEISNEEKKEDIDIDIEAEYDKIDQKEDIPHKINNSSLSGFEAQWEEFIKKNPDMKNRVPAGANIPGDLNDPKEKNNIFWRISKWILWENNR